MSFYGDSTLHTPNLDKLASESLIFDNAFIPVSICFPCGSCVATRMQPISISTHNMCTGQDYTGWGNRNYDDNGRKGPEGNKATQYAVVVPDAVKVFTQFLREKDYYCTNNFKTDMQFAVPMSAFDEKSDTAHHKNRKPGQPFFAIFNSMTTHESKIWKHTKDLVRVKPENVSLYSFFPENQTVRNDVARNYSNIEVFDD